MDNLHSWMHEERKTISTTIVIIRSNIITSYNLSALA
jgi:hypothetical protein